MTDISWLDKYTLNENNMKQFLPNKNIINANIQLSSKKKTKVEIDKDQLFWCFYIMIYGEHDYELNYSFKKEKEFKIECIEKLRKIKPQMKILKLKLNKIEDELLNCKKIGIQALLGLCLLYKKNLLYIWDRKYYEFICNADEEMNIFINKQNEIIHIINQDKVNFYKENYWQILNIDKPLKSITGYTHSELVIYC